MLLLLLSRLTCELREHLACIFSAAMCTRLTSARLENVLSAKCEMDAILSLEFCVLEASCLVRFRLCVMSARLDVAR
jgi:hypothetical protein